MLWLKLLPDMQLFIAKEFMPKIGSDENVGDKQDGPDGMVGFQRQKNLFKTGALQDAIFNSAYFSSIATDEKGVIQIFNVGAERMLGYAAVDVVDRITPADISDPQELIARAVALSVELATPITPGFEALVFKASRDIEDIYELTYIRKDGSRFPAIVSVTALRDARENIIGYLLIGADNTARKQADEALRENDALLRTIHLHSIVSVTDRAGRIIDVNEGFCRISGYSRDELLGQTHRIVNSGVQAREFWTDMWRSIAAGQPWHGEICNRTKQGSLYWVDSIVAPFMGEDGQTKRYISIRTDITAARLAEERLRSSEALLEHTGRIAGVGGWELDLRSQAVAWSAQTYRIHEVEPDYQPSHAAMIAFYPPAARTIIERVMSHGVERGTGWDLELPFITAKRSEIWVRAVGVAQFENGKAVRLIGTLQDITARKQAEEALLKAGALQSAIFNSANFSSIATDAKGVIQIFNVGAERMLGYTALDVVDRITPADISDPQELIARATTLSVELDTPITPGFEALVFKASRGIEDIYELTYIRKDGSRFPAIVSVTALRDAQSTIIGYLLIGTDNTARKQAEEALLKAGALQSAIFNSANFSSIATDAKGVIQIFNVGAERMLGYAAADVMNKITPADISDPQEVIARAAALSLELDTPITPGFEALVFKASRGIEDIYELTYIRNDGSRFPALVSVTALRDAQENIIGYLLIGTDNTARKQIEADRVLLDQRLRDQQFYTRSLIESNIDALMTTDPQGIITDVNQQMMTLTGRTRDELIGAPCNNFFTDPARADAAIKRVLTENRVSNYELTVRAMDGDETVVSYNAATFHDRDRKLQGVFAAARDVTERKRFDRTLQEKNIELEHASRMKSEFLATMSHELRTPLNAIIGFSEALKDGLMGAMSAIQQEYVGDIFTSGQHLLSLINDILDLSKVEAGMMTLELEEVDLQRLLANSLSIVKEKAAAQRIRLELEIGENLGLPQLDMRKTKQIVYNLLANAVKFTPNGGRVTLHARRVARSSVCTLAGAWPVHNFPLADSEYNEFLEICVSDNGIGISRENMTKLFLAFSQIDSSLARKFEGTGLGLAMVKQLVELHGGTVAVASAESEGARFAAWLPLRTPSQAAIAQPDYVALSAAVELEERIALVIEDDDLAADLIRLLLEEEGFTVLRAASAESALALAPQQTLSLITLDIQLPGIDGWEFLQRIRKNNLLAHVPVVIIGGLDDSNMALTHGAAAVLQKPISRIQLKSSLANLGLHPVAESTHTILVVDDDANAVEVLAAFLPLPAYAVVRAYGGSEAIALAQQLRPDLILLDLMMPEVSGFDVVAALQLNTETARIPIVVVTAKQISAGDRAALSNTPGQIIQVVDKVGFNAIRFVAEVRRALLIN